MPLAEKLIGAAPDAVTAYRKSAPAMALAVSELVIFAGMLLTVIVSVWLSAPAEFVASSPTKIWPAPVNVPLIVAPLICKMSGTLTKASVGFGLPVAASV